MYVSDG